MDIGRSAFACYKEVPGIGPVLGQYYLPGGNYPFLQRSKLGGFWWEGHPRQTGEWANTDDPAKPVWKDGTVPTGLEYPPIVTCCGRGPPRLLRYNDARIVADFGGGDVWDASPVEAHDFGEGLWALRFEHTIFDRTWFYVDFGECDCVIEYLCFPGFGITAANEDESGEVPESDYLTTFNFGRLDMQNFFHGYGCSPCFVKLRAFGEYLPGP